MMNLQKKNDNLWNSFDSIFRDAFALEMKTDITENENEYTLEVEVPGIAKENIEVTFEDDYLVVHAHQAAKKDERSYLSKERTSLDMTRSYYLENVDESSITAKMENGILTLHVAKLKAIPNPKKVIEIE